MRARIEDFWESEPIEVIWAIQGFKELRREDFFLALAQWDEKIKKPQDLGLFPWEKDKPGIVVTETMREALRERIRKRDEKIRAKDGESVSTT